jgi:serine/threonine-protein kinase
VGVDGIARLIDFGVAKALGRYTTTGPGEVRGKLSYMAPEQVRGQPATRQSDVYAAGVMLWELLAGRRLFEGEVEAQVFASALRGHIPQPSSVDPEIPAELDALVQRATAADVGDRYLTAREMNADLVQLEVASPEEVGAWVRRTAADRLAARRKLIEQSAAGSPADAKPMAEVLAELESSDRTRLDQTLSDRAQSDRTLSDRTLSDRRQWEAPRAFAETRRRRVGRRWLALAAPVVVLAIGVPLVWARSRRAPPAVETTAVPTVLPSMPAPAAPRMALPDPAAVTASASATINVPSIHAAPAVPRGAARSTGTSRSLDPKSYR